MSIRLRAILPVLVLLAFASGSSAQAGILDATLTSAKAKKRTCQAGLASGAGIVKRNATATATGLVRARLSRAGRRGGDWDVAIFSREDRRLVAASSFRGLRELAEGVTYKGERLTVQACRRSGRARSVKLSVRSIAVDEAANSGPIRLVRIDVPNRAAMTRLEALGLDLTEHAREGFREALLYSAADDKLLQKAGFRYTTRIADVVATDRAELRRSRKSAAAAGPGDGAGVPSGRTDYRRLADYSSDMKKLAEQNPQWVKPITLRHLTLEGRPVEGVEISRDVNRRDGKPVFLQMGVHHAREWPSGEHAIEWAYEMVNGLRANDERVHDLLGKARVIVVPIVNPDGFNLSREATLDAPGPAVLLAEALGLVEGFAYKRRNCRVEDGATPAPGACGQPENRFLGVDPNRNYGGFWGGGGASTEVDNDTYRGPDPFSEPETRNIKDLVSRRQVTTLITNHTYSDLVLRPPGLLREGDPPDEPIYKALGDAMAAENGYTSQKSWELYDTTGTTEDWSYYATGGLGFTFEIGPAADGPTGLESYAGTGFHPPYPLGVITEWFGKYPTGGGNREAYYKALESTANAERHSVIAGSAPTDATLRLRKEFESLTSPVLQPDGKLKPPRAFPDTLDTALDVGGNGDFEWHVNPSTRPFAKESRTLKIPADTPAVTTPIEQLTVVPPASLHPIEISEDGPKGAISAYIDGADGDDWDMYLYKGEAPDPTQEVASSATESADERLTYSAPEPGRYTLEIRYFTATSGWKGAIELYEEGFSIDVPAEQETWTLTCERGGDVVSSQEVSVERGQRVDVGRVCRGGTGGGGTGGGSGGGSTPGAGPDGGAGEPSAAAIRRALGRITGFRNTRRAATFRQRFLVAGAARWTLTTRRGGRTLKLGSARRRIASAGRKRVTVRLNRRARRLLSRAGRVRVKVNTRFVTVGGRRVSASARRTLR